MNLMYYKSRMSGSNHTKMLFELICSSDKITSMIQIKSAYFNLWRCHSQLHLENFKLVSYQVSVFIIKLQQLPLGNKGSSLLAWWFQIKLTKPKRLARLELSITTFRKVNLEIILLCPWPFCWHHLMLVEGEIIIIIENFNGTMHCK